MPPEISDAATASISLCRSLETAIHSAINPRDDFSGTDLIDGVNHSVRVSWKNNRISFLRIKTITSDRNSLKTFLIERDNIYDTVTCC